MSSSKWLLFVPQLPSDPSSLRVLVWRRMRAAGALSIQNGVWMLPHTPETERFVEGLLADVTRQGASGLLFNATLMNSSLQADIIARFQADRNQDYAEFRGRCEDFLTEIAKETVRQNFSFAELEENEEDFQKLVGWLQKIQARDFFGGQEADQAIADLDQCRQAFQEYTRTVYAHEGLAPDDEETV